jgi:hypothetical protein
MNDSDRIATVSASLTIDGTAASDFVNWSGAGLVADVQDWVDGSAPNYGWLIDAPAAQNLGTTERFYAWFHSGDFADASLRPKLVVEYTIPATLEDLYTLLTEVLTRIPDATAGAAGGLALVGSEMTLTGEYGTVVDVQTAAEAAVASLGYVAPDNASAQAAAASAASADAKLTAERLTKLDGAAQEATVAELNDFDPATDVVAHVTLVDTTTTNTDMRGTDNAMLAASYTAPPTAAQNADAVWDEAVADHVTSGTFGRFLQRVYRYFFNKTLHTNTSMVVYADDGTTSDAVMAVSGDTSSVTKGAAS